LTDTVWFVNNHLLDLTLAVEPQYLHAYNQTLTIAMSWDAANDRFISTDTYPVAAGHALTLATADVSYDQATGKFIAPKGTVFPLNMDFETLIFTGKLVSGIITFEEGAEIPQEPAPIPYEPTLPPTGDSTQGILALTALLALCGVTFVVASRRKDRQR
jgi:LPXTG-motif cell wall-anchored protein